MFGAENGTRKSGETPHQRWRAFERNCVQEIGDRFDERGNRPEGFNPETKLFPAEQKLYDSLRAFYMYLSPDDRAMVDASAGLMFQAHQTQYRDSGDPYPVHPLSVVLKLVRRYSVDATTICSALLHDAAEDTKVTIDLIREKIHPDVAEAVSGLTKIRGRHQRKALAEEENRIKIISSLLDNPRVALIKIMDRLHNLETLGKKKGRAARRKIIHETYRVYIPLAKRLGMFDEANELDAHCLTNTSVEHGEWALKAEQFIQKYFPEEALRKYEKDVRAASLRGTKIIARKPSAADIYRNIGELREVTAADMILYVTIVDHQFRLREKEGSYTKWGERAMLIANGFNWGAFQRTQALDVLQFRQELEGRVTDSLRIYIERSSDSMRAVVTIFPENAYDLEQTSLAYLYSANGRIDYAQKRNKAREKHELLKNKLRLAAADGVSSAQILRQLEFRLPHGFIPVTGINDKGDEEPWSIQAGSTILDYVRDIAESDFNTAVDFLVFRRESGAMEQVDPDYVLQQGDKIHIEFNTSVRRWDPLWIHCFGRDEEGRRIVRNKVKKLMNRLQSEKRTEELVRLGDRIVEAAKRRLEWVMHEEILLDLDRHPEVFKETLGRQVNKKDFFYEVGLGDVSDEEVTHVGRALRALQKNISVVRAYFGTSREGQGSDVLRVAQSQGVDLAHFESDQPIGYIALYIDPDDREKVGEIITAIRKDPSCRKWLARVSMHPLHGTQEEIYYSNGAAS